MVPKIIEVQRTVYNLTTTPYYVFDYNGEIVELAPCYFALPECLKDNVNYIVNQRDYIKAKQRGRRPGDLLFVSNYGKSRGGVYVVRLIPYENKTIRVYPIKGS